ncbi:NhaP-type Na /H and K /H antiporter [Cenarchaeum symbiosum A]|uniref:NhaP-type Na /H and K /H antiporter n=1 Tax=Cenarchaeum symbiosum (strain A) TaxID=414004 RepID=A0RYR9_CENSY|nr:NhaP-type Na /H and K /H antiporter [Cenarchaeum symbiosum A]
MIPVALSLFGVVAEFFESRGLAGEWALPGPLLDVQEAFSAITITDGDIAAAPVLLLAAGVVIFLGVAGEAFFKRTGVPDVAFLMVLGVVLGPVLGIIQPEVVAQIVPYFAAIALIIIMFDGGLNLDLRHMARTAHFAVALSVIGFIVSVAIVAVMAHYIIGWEWMSSIVLGTIVGGSSSVIVFNLVRNISVSEEARSMLSFESAITDILATIIAFIMFEAILSGEFSPELLGETIGRALMVGLVLGLGVGIPWMYVTTKFGNAQHAYMLTLGILFVLFFMANTFGESGALTALVFGLMLGNKQRLSRIFRFKVRMIESDDPTHSQLTFLVRAFFFVFVGLLASFGQIEYAVLGIAATVVIYVSRAGIVRAVLTKRFSKIDRKVTEVMIPRGLAAAVLATLPLTLGLPNAEAYPQIIFFIILASVVITTAGLGSAKKIAPPERVEGGYVKMPDEKGEPEPGGVEGGYVKMSDEKGKDSGKPGA